MPNEAEQKVVIPRHAFGHREKDLRMRAPCLDDSQAAAGSLEEVACAPQGEAERLLRIPHRLEVTGEAIEELEELEFPLLSDHDLEVWKREPAGPGPVRRSYYRIAASGGRR